MELARLLGVNAAAVKRQAKGIEKDDWVERSADQRDGRRSNVRLIDKGGQFLGLVHDRAHEFEKARCGSSDDEEIAVAVSVLAKVRDAIERQMAHDSTNVGIV